MRNFAFRPYIERGTHELRYIHDILNQKDEAIPVDLEAALVAHGIPTARS